MAQALDLHHLLQQNGLLEFCAEAGLLEELINDAGCAVGQATQVPTCIKSEPEPDERLQSSNHTAQSAVAAANAALAASRARVYQLANAQAPVVSCAAPYVRPVEQAEPGFRNKGLKQFGLKVCEKISSRGRTTYNEVADELVRELAGNGADQTDEKNIRRRVYDAINVLEAVNIIAKQKKEVIWRGWPQQQQPPVGPAPSRSRPSCNPAGGASAAPMEATIDTTAVDKLRADRAQHIMDVERKQQYLQELIDQHSALHLLLQRNPKLQPGNGTSLQLPFIIIQAKPDAMVGVNISQDMLDVQFDFYDSPFHVYDDSHILKQMAAQQNFVTAQAQSVQRHCVTAGHTGHPTPLPLAQCTNGPTTSTSRPNQDGSQLPLRGPGNATTTPGQGPCLPPLSTTHAAQQLGMQLQAY